MELEIATTLDIIEEFDRRGISFILWADSPLIDYSEFPGLATADHITTPQAARMAHHITSFLVAQAEKENRK